MNIDLIAVSTGIPDGDLAIAQVQITHDFCKRNNVSSCWSNIAPATPVTPTLPNGSGYK
ncbi:hypothetical protein MNO14_14430 [Luteimonas sp. S4-F44]|nr:hypothetical protein [Luteimonas sp. S4-F44]UNK42123.1 hypothetical protein MNO14_14430 [Luteimonas sp. S4-F44]